MALWQPKKDKKKTFEYIIKWWMINTSFKYRQFPPLTCVCFFGSGATDFEMLLTSLWTSVKIWLRFSTFSFFKALICEATNYSMLLEQLQQTKENIKYMQEKGEERNNRQEILRVWALSWQVSLCSCASGACLQLERRSSVFSPFVYSSPCYLRRRERQSAHGR